LKDFNLLKELEEKGIIGEENKTGLAIFGKAIELKK